MDQQVQIAMDCQVAIGALTQALEAQGMRVYRSFDLRTALVALPDCGCPYHGTDRCTCQYAVLLVYGDAPSPALVAAHGRDGWTWLAEPKVEVHSTTLKKRVMNVLAALAEENSLDNGRGLSECASKERS